MTRDEVIRMALEAGFKKDKDGLYFFPLGNLLPDDDMTPPLERFAALVAAAEREDCAKVCEQSDRHRGAYFADKIRAGEK